MCAGPDVGMPPCFRGNRPIFQHFLQKNVRWWCFDVLAQRVFEEGFARVSGYWDEEQGQCQSLNW